MIFIIGGAYQGKLEYALDLFNLKEDDVANCLNADKNDICTKPVIYNFHLLIKRLLEEYKESSKVKEEVNAILAKNPNAVIISNEIGYGVVPIDKFDRQYRELTGRISCEVVKNSSEVHRVVCGIGTIIKEEKND